jgi:hypothetical protein
VWSALSDNIVYKCAYQKIDSHIRYVNVVNIHPVDAYGLKFPPELPLEGISKVSSLLVLDPDPPFFATAFALR